MDFPRNKWTAAAVLWFALGVYALIFRENADLGAPPFPHFDKLAHALLFFAQIWLAAKAFLAERRPLPLLGLAVFALLCAGASEWAQGAFTQSRQADIWDVAADMLGAAAALSAAYFLQNLRKSKD